MVKNFLRVFLNIYVVLSIVLTTLSLPVFAATNTPKLDDCPTGNKEKCTNLENPLQNKTTNVPLLIGIIIKYALTAIGSLALLMFVWGGFQWLTSVGNAEKIKKGSQTMIWAAIGVALVLTSYIILSTYLNYLTGNT